MLFIFCNIAFIDICKFTTGDVARCKHWNRYCYTGLLLLYFWWSNM